MNDVLIAFDDFEITLDQPSDECPGCAALVLAGRIEVRIAVGEPASCSVCGAVLVHP